MNVQLEPGKYVIAVSGGVDSMSLLHLLKAQPNVALVVAHFDHGIRTDSAEDAQLVARTAEHYGLPFELGHGNLGAQASEAEARQARYAFLEKVRDQHQARAIITAHHQDDVLETAILNILRGTGRKGLTALSSRQTVIRPLLETSKTELRQYAQEHGVSWREDSTNASEHYTRNYIRKYIMPRFSEAQKAKLREIISKSQSTNEALDFEIHHLLQQGIREESLDRHTFIMLPHAAAREVMAGWLRSKNLREFDKTTIERLVVAAKTGKPGSQVNVYGPHVLRIDKHKLALGGLDR